MYVIKVKHLVKQSNFKTQVARLAIFRHTVELFAASTRQY